MAKSFISTFFFFVLVKSSSISPVRLQRPREKGFVPAFKDCIDHLFDNLQSGKKEIIVLEKSLEKVLNFGFKNLYKPCLDKWSLVGGGRTWRVNCIFIFQTPEVQTQSSDYSIGAQPVVKVQPINGNRRVTSNGITQSGDMENGAGEPHPVIRAQVAANVRSFPGDRLIGVNNSFATVETRRELEPNCVAQLFLGWLLGTRWSAIGQFFSLSLVTFPEVFAKVTSAQSSSLF